MNSSLQITFWLLRVQHLLHLYSLVTLLLVSGLFGVVCVFRAVKANITVSLEHAVEAFEHEAGPVKVEGDCQEDSGPKFDQKELVPKRDTLFFEPLHGQEGPHVLVGEVGLINNPRCQEHEEQEDRVDGLDGGAFQPVVEVEPAQTDERSRCLHQQLGDSQDQSEVLRPKNYVEVEGS